MSFLTGEVKKQNQGKVVNGDHPLADTTYSEHEKYSYYSTDAILSEEQNQPIHNHAQLMFKFCLILILTCWLQVSELSLQSKLTLTYADITQTWWAVTTKLAGLIKTYSQKAAC